jgi:hypothetical protein
VAPRVDRRRRSFGRLLARAFGARDPFDHLRPPQPPIQRPRQTRCCELEVCDAASARACRGRRGVQQQRPERQQSAAPRGACDLGDLAPHVFDLVLAQLAERMRLGKHAHGAVVGGAVVEVHRTVTMPAKTSAGGCTWTTPSFTDHGPNPSSSWRAATAIATS